MYKNDYGDVVHLATDAGFVATNVVWERIIDVGGNSDLLDSNFNIYTQPPPQHQDSEQEYFYLI